MDCAREWERRFQNLQEEMRNSRKRTEKKVQKQNEVIMELMSQTEKQKELYEKQTIEISTLNELVLKLSKNSQESRGRAEGTVIIAGNSNYSEKLENRQSRADDLNSLEPVVSQLGSRVSTLTADVQALQNWVDNSDQHGGTTYVRWGSKTCPSAAQLVYSGYVGGSWYDQRGAAANYLCLPQHPSFDDHNIPPALNSYNHVQELYGAEYQATTEVEHDTLPACSVCHVPKSAIVMIPSTDECVAGWTLEYHGYLMAGASTHPAASEYVCVDANEEYIAGTNRNEDGKLLYYTVTRCGSLPCPPYVNNKIVTCVVCSK